MRENPPPQGKQLGYQPFVFDGRAHITTQLSRIGRSRSFGQTIHMWVVLQAFPKAAHIEDMGVGSNRFSQPFKTHPTVWIIEAHESEEGGVAMRSHRERPECRGFVKLTKIPPDIRTEAAIKLPVKGCLLDVTRH
jgi:hypothetical protein